ncbi:MAG: hypothetical protein P8X55_18295, partial [Desulfosarcinaceae bacterium]
PAGKGWYGLGTDLDDRNLHERRINRAAPSTQGINFIRAGPVGNELVLKFPAKTPIFFSSHFWY